MIKRVGPGEKIRRLRLAMGLTQDALTNDELSKSIVSMIENNKRNLTWDTAHIIADCLNTYYEGIGQNITAEYLMETEEEEARRTIKNNIDQLKKAIENDKVDEVLVENTFEKIIGEINEWGLEKEMAELKILRGKFYYHNYQYKKALRDYLDALDYYLKVEDYMEVAKTYNSIGNVYQMQMTVDIALVHYAKAFDIARVHQPEGKEKIKLASMYNQILCYRKMKRYDLAFSHISIFKDLKASDPRYKYMSDRITILEANTYRDVNNFEKALKLYDKVASKEDQLDLQTKFLLYDNYAQLYRQQSNPQQALTYINKAKGLKDSLDINFLPALLLLEAKCYNLLEDYELMVSLLENALRLADKVSKLEILLEVHYAFVEVYMETEEFEIALAHLHTIENLILEKNLDLHKKELYSFYGEVYLGLGEIEKVKEYLSKMRKKYITD